ncbi:YdcF family protein [Curtobacterium sp. 9128]|uniref:YdcF family protein n=1 Tax=Curtobacterium sp. 9128 TaxID=1793722 RepID=UPI0021B2F8A5|nr:YdcF family protein [Curtobacterium sp. 9128]
MAATGAVAPAMTASVLPYLVAAGFFALYAVGRVRDPRMLRNGVFLTIAAFLAVTTTAGMLARTVPGAAVVLGAVVALLPLAVLVLGVALIANGVLMLRREGRSLGNLLSLVAGVVVLALPVALVLGYAWLSSVRERPVWLLVLASVGFLAVLLSLYVAGTFVAFALYSVVYARMRRTDHPAAVVVLGSGLVHGDVPPLLRSRLDRALAVYRSAPAGRRPLLVPSGGQGRDEPRSEGTAMAEYLVAQGVPAEDVVPETASRNTRQNLEYSMALLTERGRAERVLVATNEYHVLRAAVLARQVGLDAQVVGARTARYYVPSAFIREYVAVVLEYRWLNALACVPLVVLAAYALWSGLSGPAG